MTSMIIWKGHEHLDHLGLSVYKVAEKVEELGGAAKNTVYIFFRNGKKGALKRVDLDVLDAVLTGINSLTDDKHKSQPNDLLEWVQ